MKDIVAEANDIRQLERDVRLLWDSEVVHECLQKREELEKHKQRAQWKNISSR